MTMTEEQFKKAEEDLIQLRTLATQLQFWDDAKMHHDELVALRLAYKAQT